MDCVPRRSRSIANAQWLPGPRPHWLCTVQEDAQRPWNDLCWWFDSGHVGAQDPGGSLTFN